MNKPAAPYHGQCLCGAVRYEFDAISPRMGHCHCSMCRKFHGAAFATFAEIQKSDFRWLSGKSDLKSYTAGNKSVRRFCRHCGSSMIFEASGSDGSVIELAMGTLDTPVPHPPDAHIFTASKAAWYDIQDGLPQFETDRNSQKMLQEK